MFIKEIVRKILYCYYKNKFMSLGENVKFHPFDKFSFSTINIGNNVFIDKGAWFSASKGNSISIGNKVMFGPNVTIIGGDHNTSKIGQYMFDVKTKCPEDDQPIEISNDVWIAANVTILKGVKIGEGSIIGACSLVNKSILPYTVAVGVPARMIKLRFPLSTIKQHSEMLGSQIDFTELYKSYSEFGLIQNETTI